MKLTFHRVSALAVCHSAPSQQPETTRPELEAPIKPRKGNMCIVNATKAYKPPAARTATAFAQLPAPTFAVVAPPKRFDATASDAR